MTVETEGAEVPQLSDYTTLCIIVGGPQSLVWGSHDLRTLFAWTSQESAERFIEAQEIQRARVLEEPIDRIRQGGRSIGFSEVLVDFVGDGDPTDIDGPRISL